MAAPGIRRPQSEQERRQLVWGRLRIILDDTRLAADCASSLQLTSEIASFDERAHLLDARNAALRILSRFAAELLHVEAHIDRAIAPSPLDREES